MKKLLFLSGLLACFAFSHAQIFGTAQTLSQGKGNFGILPTITISDGNNDLILYLQGGYGLAKGVDLGIRLGLEDKTYIGADVEFSLAKNFSFTGGFHSYYDFGIDLAGIYTFKLNSSTKLSTGLDADLIFNDYANITPVWIPLNIEVSLKKNMVFMLEADIDTKLIDESYNMISGGLQFYF